VHESNCCDESALHAIDATSVPDSLVVCAQVKVPVGAVWKLLPWNRGLPPTCAVEQVYLDDDVRIAKDTSGQYFVYARPV